ncbi:DUF59 domain-containing protein [Pacificimonas sp. WHA3]|uniref:DUF59 domain-containing protein n=2 Tax=Pacificimonas pallii TaxID=2827236 RepID=A0ABS6SFW3_9SPHN|nr:DUF59 domain-containing protein [Pacificimonas pallii]
MDPALQSTNRNRSSAFDGPENAKPLGVDAKDAPRGKDYLEGFLKESPNTPDEGAPAGRLYEQVVETLREIYDPEIPVNIYDLGLIYGVDIVDDHAVVTMTLTTPHCPVAESMPAEVEIRTGAVPGIGSAEVNLTFDPPWDPGKMSDEAKLELGML